VNISFLVFSGTREYGYTGGVGASKIPEHFKYPAIAACGLSCALCPGYVMTTKSRCPGCKTDWRFGGPCSIIHCIVKKEGIEFCWDCPDGEDCEKWNKHRRYGRQYDSFISYQKLEDNIAYAREHGAKAFAKYQADKAKLLHELLDEFNEGRSKSFFCRAATVLEIDELKAALKKGRNESKDLGLKAKAKLMHMIIEDIAKKQGYCLVLRKAPPKAHANM
jgi:hypothetical protein